MAVAEPAADHRLVATTAAAPTALPRSKTTTNPADEDPLIPLSPWRRRLVLFTVCWNTVPAIFTSTSIMAASAEVAADLATTTGTITAVNACVFVSMAASPLIWMPMAALLGRRAAIVVGDALVCACMVVSALSPNVGVFAALWILSGNAGPFFLVSGQTIIADVYQPTIRGAATGVYLATCNMVTVLAPMIGAVIATFTSWRVIFGINAGVTFIATALSFFFVPIPPPRSAEPRATEEKSTDGNTRRAMAVLRAFNPAPVFREMRKPKVIVSHITCGLLSFNMFSLLSSVRRVINPRFGLTSPLMSGLFYLAPGAGFLIGSSVGGVLSDQTVRRYLAKRGRRLPQDRLRSCLPAMLLVLPGGTLAYGWSLDREVGDVALPIVASFVFGVGLMAAFSTVNTYSSEVVPERRTAVISGKYVAQYCLSAISVASVVPMVDAIGIGCAFTISAAAAILGGILLAGIVVMVTRADVKALGLEADEESDTGVFGAPAFRSVSKTGECRACKETTVQGGEFGAFGMRKAGSYTR